MVGMIGMIVGGWGIVGWFRRVFVRAMIQAVGGVVLEGAK